MRILAFATALSFIPLVAHAKREAPTEVPPVVIDGVQFEAPHFATPCGQNGGCIVATDAASRAPQWTVKLYCTTYDPKMETDVQDVFITSMVADGKRLVITDEKNRHFTLDPVTRQVSGDDAGCGNGGGCSFGGTGAPWSIAGLLALLWGVQRRARLRATGISSSASRS